METLELDSLAPHSYVSHSPSSSERPLRFLTSFSYAAFHPIKQWFATLGVHWKYLVNHSSNSGVIDLGCNWAVGFLKLPGDPKVGNAFKVGNRYAGHVYWFSVKQSPFPSFPHPHSPSFFTSLIPVTSLKFNSGISGILAHHPKPIPSQSNALLLLLFSC